MKSNSLQEILDKARLYRKENSKLDNPGWVNRTLAIRNSYQNRSSIEIQNQKNNARKAIREKIAIPQDIINKIFIEFHDINREIDDKTFKKLLSERYNITISHLNKICMARSNYVKYCIGLTDEQIKQIKERYINSKPKYRIKTFGIDVMHLYNNYSYRSKFPVKIVWECRFGKYKNMKRPELKKVLGLSLSYDDFNSLKQSYPWLTNDTSKELFYGDYAGATKFIKNLPTRNEKFAFIKTGKYQGCFICYE